MGVYITQNIIENVGFNFKLNRMKKHIPSFKMPNKNLEHF